jgi:hypothetical protein
MMSSQHTHADLKLDPAARQQKSAHVYTEHQEEPLLGRLMSSQHTRADLKLDPAARQQKGTHVCTEHARAKKMNHCWCGHLQATAQKEDEEATDA